MKKFRFILAMMLAILMAINLTTCGGGGGGDGGSPSSGGSSSGGGVTTPEASAKIGPSGGTVEVTNSSSPLYGVKVEVPQGALDENITITIKQVAIEPPVPQTAVKVSKTISLGPDSIVFNLPVSITIPYNDANVKDENTLQIYSYNGFQWESATFKSRDTKANTLSALIGHFSDYGALEPTNSQKTGLLTTGFTPALNGFPIDNPASSYCAGMVAYAKWFFEFKKGILYTAYNAIRAIEVAETAHNALLELTEIDRGVYFFNYFMKSDKDVADQLISNLKIGRPQILSILETDKSSGKLLNAHSVLVYAYDYDSGLFYFYDPEFHGIGCTIKFDGQNLEDYYLKGNPLTADVDYAVMTNNRYDWKAMNAVYYAGTWQNITVKITAGNNAGGSYVLQNIKITPSRLGKISFTINKTGSACPTPYSGYIIDNVANVTSESDYWFWWIDTNKNWQIDPGESGECCIGTSKVDVTFSNDKNGAGLHRADSCGPITAYYSGDLTLSR